MRERKISKYSMSGATSVSIVSSRVISFSLRLTLTSDDVAAKFTRSWMSNEVVFGLRTRLRCTSLLSAMITAADTALTGSPPSDSSWFAIAPMIVATSSSSKPVSTRMAWERSAPVCPWLSRVITLPMSCR